MKKSLFVLLAASALTLVACGETPASSPEGGEGERTSRTSRTPRPSSDQSGQSTPESTPEASTSALPALDGTNVFYNEGVFKGAEIDSTANPGRIYYWSGDGGNISSFTKAANGDLVIEYTNVETPGEGGWGWYGCQVFYTAPYAQGGESYTIRATINSDAAGDITINGKVISLVRGDTLIQETFVRGEEGRVASTISMQLGVNNPASTLQGYMLKIKGLEIYDAVGRYHDVQFKNGEEVVKRINVLSGKTVAAPKVTPPEGKLLQGWFDGDSAYSATDPITAAHVYVARFVEDTGSHVVTVMNGSDKLGEVKVPDGATADLSSVETPFGYRNDGFYADAALTQAFNGNTPITGDLTVYGKYLVSPVCWINAQEAGFTFHDEISHDADGSFRLQFVGWNQASWHVQVNFAPLPTGQAGKSYVFEFRYEMNVAGGSYKIYDGADVGEVKTLSAESGIHTGSVQYAGGALTDGNKMTIELGSLPAENVVFVIHSVSWHLAA